MIPAAVGFQCPDCVGDGMRTTRQNQGPYGGIRAKNPSQTAVVLIVINVLVWGLGQLNRQITTLLSLTPYGRCMAGEDMWYPGAGQPECAGIPDAFWSIGVATGGFWQLLTSGFAHADLMHLGFNMLALWFIAPSLERVLGRGRLLAIYLLSILSGSTLALWFMHPQTDGLGASGGIFGLLAAFLLVAWRLRGNVRTVLIWLSANLVFTFLGPFVGMSISWEGHIGGLVGGAAAAAVIIFAPKLKRERYQLIGLVGIALLCVALIALRVALISI